jgi:hypothetical protein
MSKKKNNKEDENVKDEDEDINIYGVNNNSSSSSLSSSSSSSYLMDEDDDEIVKSTNLKKQTIPVTIYHIQKQLKFIHNEIKEINNRLDIGVLSTNERLRIRSREIFLNENLKKFKNNLIQLNKKINDCIYVHTGSRMLNSNSIYLDDFWFYENVINVNNVSDLLVDKKNRYLFN